MHAPMGKSIITKKSSIGGHTLFHGIYSFWIWIKEQYLAPSPKDVTTCLCYILCMMIYTSRMMIWVGHIYLIPETSLDLLGMTENSVKYVIRSILIWYFIWIKLNLFYKTITRLCVNHIWIYFIKKLERTKPIFI
jgi:hypothetical protein